MDPFYSLKFLLKKNLQDIMIMRKTNVVYNDSDQTRKSTFTLFD